MDKIGILCASDTELEPFLSHIHDVKTTEKAMLKFYEGTISSVSVAAVYSGVCKVNAAIAAQLLIDVFQVDRIINAGVSGGMDESVQLFDTIVAEEVAYHDVDDDILTEFHPWMKSVYFQADQQLVMAMREYSKASEHPILFGRTVTGEQFIADNKRDEINQKFSPLSVDMEAGSIAHVCYVNKIPFLSVKSITDTPTHSGIENFEENCEKAAAISADIVMGFIGSRKK